MCTHTMCNRLPGVPMASGSWQPLTTRPPLCLLLWLRFLTTKRSWLVTAALNGEPPKHILRSGFNSSVLGGAFVRTPLGLKAVTSNENDKRVHIWNVLDGVLEHTVVAPGPVGRVCAHPFQPQAAVVSGNGSIILVDVVRGEVVRQLDIHTDWIRSMSFSSDAKRLLTASNQGCAVITNLETGEVEQMFKPSVNSWISSAAWVTHQKVILGTESTGIVVFFGSRRDARSRCN
eukprot:TRINITY_DN3270_c0_g1_i4.p1 TRINITY_DN3270_c0_g1~~TRINITY_DN3270_c0_g1_i4.p1  ORF type:complete len:232 (-),score=31.47 TRINITY_DN3270_c0_g1_i4:199-894(-)